LRLGVSLLSRFTVPRCHLRVALRNAFTIYAQTPRMELRIGLALVRREVYRLHCYASTLQVRKYPFKCFF
jgi:hypothetical protein